MGADIGELVGIGGGGADEPKQRTAVEHPVGPPASAVAEAVRKHTSAGARPASELLAEAVGIELGRGMQLDIGAQALVALRGREGGREPGLMGDQDVSGRDQSPLLQGQERRGPTSRDRLIDDRAVPHDPPEQGRHRQPGPAAGQPASSV